MNRQEAMEQTQAQTIQPSKFAFLQGNTRQLLMANDNLDLGFS